VAAWQKAHISSGASNKQNGGKGRGKEDIFTAWALIQQIQLTSHGEGHHPQPPCTQLGQPLSLPSPYPAYHLEGPLPTTCTPPPHPRSGSYACPAQHTHHHLWLATLYLLAAAWAASWEGGKEQGSGLWAEGKTALALTSSRATAHLTRRGNMKIKRQPFSDAWRLGGWKEGSTICARPDNADPDLFRTGSGFAVGWYWFCHALPPPSKRHDLGGVQLLCSNEISEYFTAAHMTHTSLERGGGTAPHCTPFCLFCTLARGDHALRATIPNTAGRRQRRMLGRRAAYVLRFCERETGGRDPHRYGCTGMR